MWYSLWGVDYISLRGPGPVSGYKYSFVCNKMPKPLHFFTWKLKKKHFLGGADPLFGRLALWLTVRDQLVFINAQNPLHSFPRNFRVHGKLPPCCQQVVVIEFGKRHDTTDTTNFCPRQLVTDLLRTCFTGKSPTCYGLATGKLV